MHRSLATKAIPNLRRHPNLRRQPNLQHQLPCRRPYSHLRRARSEPIKMTNQQTELGQATPVPVMGQRLGLGLG